MQPPEGYETIFLNHDRLDCRRAGHSPWYHC
jgi:hypothetical protein